MPTLNEMLAQGIQAPLMGEAFQQGKLQKMAIDAAKQEQAIAQQKAQREQATFQDTERRKREFEMLTPHFLSEDPSVRRQAIVRATMLDPQAGKAIRDVLTNSEMDSTLREVLLNAGLNPFDSSPYFDPEMAEPLGQSFKELQDSKRLGKMPKDLITFDAFQKMTPEEQEAFLSIKRATPAEIGARTRATEAAKTDEIPRRAEAEEQAEDMKGARKRVEAAKSSITRSESVLEEIGVAIERANNRGATGVLGQTTKHVKSSPAGRLSQAIDTLKANLSFDRIAEMRKNSPTGGALGQVSERELKLLGDSVTALDPGMSREDLIRGLEKVRRHYQNWIDVQKESMQRDQGLLNVDDAAEEKRPEDMTDEELKEALGGG